MKASLTGSGKKVMIAMSGGVDSSVAAALLLEAGYSVIGVTMQIWPDKSELPGSSDQSAGTCCSIEAVQDAKRVADLLCIPHYTLNLKDVFKEKVIDYFIREYISGRTPNPCIACNRHIKFGALLEKAISMEMDYVATGHYAAIEQSSAAGRYILKKSAAFKKDQTYVLYDMTQDQLSKVLFPLAGYNKAQVREIASRLGLPTASKQESQEICFVEDDDYARYISENYPSAFVPGEFADINGNHLGRHEGIAHFTIGQRKGLGKAFGKPMFVVAIDAVRNRVILGDESQLFSDSLTAGDLNWIAIANLDSEMKVMAKIRYNAQEVPSKLIPAPDGKLMVKFDSPQRAVTPGQSVVFYDGDIVVGGGIIEL